jgi:hypothetical protein
VGYGGYSRMRKPGPGVRHRRIRSQAAVVKSNMPAWTRLALSATMMVTNPCLGTGQTCQGNEARPWHAP